MHAVAELEKCRCFAIKPMYYMLNHYRKFNFTTIGTFGLR